MSDANLRGRLPDGDNNGLAYIATDMLAEPRQVRTAVVLFDTVAITTNLAERTRTATGRIRHIEPIVNADDLIEVDKLLRAALRRRCGTDELPGGLGLDQPVLPFDDEED